MDPQPQGQQQIQLRIDESKMATTYANTFRPMSTGEEVLLDSGLHIPMQNQGGGTVINFQVGSRVVMGWPAAKRLVMQLGQMVRAYEERNGEIQVQQAQQAPAAPTMPPADNA